MVKKKTQEQKKIETKKEPRKDEFIHAVGRRREAVARVRLYPNGEGQIVVNEKPVEHYFPLLYHKVVYNQPFELTETVGKFTVTVKVLGGGLSGQVEAVRLGIARALDKYDREKFHPLLKKHGLLTRDSRVRQRRMVGTGGKARRKKQSPKR